MEQKFEEALCQVTSEKFSNKSLLIIILKRTQSSFSSV